MLTIVETKTRALGPFAAITRTSNDDPSAGFPTTIES